MPFTPTFEDMKEIEPKYRRGPPRVKVVPIQRVIAFAAFGSRVRDNASEKEYQKHVLTTVCDMPEPDKKLMMDVFIIRSNINGPFTVKAGITCLTHIFDKIGCTLSITIKRTNIKKRDTKIRTYTGTLVDKLVGPK